MPTEPPETELLLRLSTIEGFTLRHLRRLRSGAPLSLPGTESGPVRHASLLDRGAEAAVSREAGAAADRIRSECARKGIRIVPAGSPEYPPPLLDVPDAPLLLFWKGCRWDDREGVAVVGSRAPTAPGRAFARELSTDLALAGVAVVSGMARGIDSAAHEGALAGGGFTAAVLGCGVDVAYPPESAGLRDRILEGGAVVSEYAPGTRPAAWRFPARNRIVSGICRAVVVAEAPSRSGALVTARLALDQGREVLSVPGSPYFPHTEGSNRLLRDGAVPVTDVADVLEAIGRRGGIFPGKKRTIII